MRKCLVEACETAGKRVHSVVNHDGSRIAEDLFDDYAAMIEHLMTHHYASTSRYTTSAFMRLKMQEALDRRGVAPHVFERAEETHDILNRGKRTAAE